MAFSIQDIIGGNLLDAVSKIIDQFHASPEQKAQLQLAIQQNADAVKQAENDYNAKLNDIAGQNIRTEASGGPYERNARPSVIWIGLGVIVWNYCVRPFFHSATLTPVDIPSFFWETWGIICTGYVFNRTAEKIMAMPGDSSIKLPLGIQVGQNSPK
jgi:hypothetical protein